MYQSHFGGKLSSSFYYAVPDPDLEIRGRRGGGGVIQTLRWGKNFSWPFGPQFGLNIRGEGGWGAGPLPWIFHCYRF